MQQFVLIDQSIRGLTGHHYEYAVHVLGAAEKAGYQPVLAANRKFTKQVETNWRIFREYDFWFCSKPRKLQLGRRQLKFFRRIWFRLRCELRYSELGLFWLGRTDSAKYLSRKPHGFAGFLIHALSLKLIVAAKVLRLPVLLLLLPIWAVVLPLVALRDLLRLFFRLPLFQRYVRAVLLELRKYLEFATSLTGHGDSRYGAIRREPPNASGVMAAAFGRDTRNLFRKVNLQSGDMVFLPAISHHNLLGLLELFRAGQLPAGANWHFLFRRNLYPGTLEDSPDCGEEIAEIRDAFQVFQQKIGDHKVFFYTDSTELTRQYDRLGTFSFHTLPIPHTYVAPDAAVGAGPLRVTYLGDARREKGYHLLPRIVGDLRQEGLAGKLQFVFQSNYNIPRGEPEAVVARGQLESFPGSMVHLRKEPLPTEDYKTLLLSSDITILPYDRTNYGARSSGVLVESLAAGIPVIVPAGTWLSRQLLTAGYADGEGRARNKMTVVESFGQSALSWCCHGTSDVSALVGGKLEAGFESKASCWLHLPESVTDLLVTVRFSKPPLDGCLYVTELREDDSELGPMRRFYLQGGANERKCTVVCRLAPQARKLWVAVGSAHMNARIQIEDTRMDLLRQPPGRSLPSGGTGLAYQEVEEIPELIREIADHYPHYRRTAAEFAKRWRSFHNADHLIAKITQNAGGGYGIAAQVSNATGTDGGSAAKQDIPCA